MALWLTGGLGYFRLIAGLDCLGCKEMTDILFGALIWGSYLIFIIFGALAGLGFSWTESNWRALELIECLRWAREPRSDSCLVAGRLANLDWPTSSSGKWCDC